MKSSWALRGAMLVFCAGTALLPGLGQSGSALPAFGAGVKISTLGAGIEAATALTRRSNLRVGFNAFSYDYDLTQDGIDYAAGLRLRSVEAHYDWFLGHGFHVSPGLLTYDGNRASGRASVPGGRSFTLGSNRYLSNPANPVTGTAEVDFSKHKVAPMVSIGFGNLLPRGRRRFSVSFEAGVVFGGSPKATLNFTGSACTSLGVNCQNISSNSQLQNDIQSEQNKINNGLSPYDNVQTVFNYYPVISVGFGYKFR